MVQSSAGENKAKRIRRISEANWSELLPELLLDVGMRLESRIDVSKFRSVCKNWRSSLPLPKNPNFLNRFLPLQIQIPFTEQVLDRFTLTATTVFLVQPLDDSVSNYSNNSKSKCWILSVEETEPGKFRILYPLSRKRVSYKDPNFPKFLNFTEFRVRVSEIGKGYLLRVSDKFHHGDYYRTCKVVLCFNSAEFGPYSTVDDRTAIVLYPDGVVIGLNLRNGYWNKGSYIAVMPNYDLLWLDGVVYAVDDVGRLFVINHMTFKKINVIVKDSIHESLGPKRLVDSSGEVYLVALYWKKIYKLNRMQRKWEEITTLGNRTVYLGCDACFMVPTQSLLGHDGDFIVFNEKSMFNGYCLRDLRFCEAAEGRGMFMYCFRTGDSMESEIDLSYQAISSSLWPPPTWFW